MPDAQMPLRPSNLPRLYRSEVCFVTLNWKQGFREMSDRLGSKMNDCSKKEVGEARVPMKRLYIV